MRVNSTDKGIILIIDDTPTNLEILLDFLENHGYKVVVSEDGESAIEMAEYAPPDLILLDIIMPGIDGFETCRRLKANQVTQDIPIIFMTALADNVDKVKGLNLGAVDYITKPLEHEEVLARINIHLRLQNLTKKLIEQNVRLEEEIKQRQQAQQKISEQAALLDIATDAIFVQDLSNNIVFWNKGAERLYGWEAEEAIGKNVLELLYKEISPEIQEPLENLTYTGEWLGELNQVTKDGKNLIVTSRWTKVLDSNGQLKSILVVNTDITEKKQLESQFLRAQRMESLGVLAGGIAHDLNNVLTPVLMAVQLLETKLHDEQSQQWLQILENNVNRGADLIKQVLSFTKGISGERTTLQVSHLIQEIKQLASETFPKSICVNTNINRDLKTVLGDATQLHQVLLNLVVNARDAMPQGGILKIEANNIYIDEHYARINIDSKIGEYILISVSDTGIGIDRNILERIFEPFFTTKELGKGTGLGLSTVVGIVKSHGGFINVYSEVGKGTEFRVYLPSSEIIEIQQSLDSTNLLKKGRGQLILVAEDEEPIRNITKTVLEINGYRVITAADGAEAILLYRQYQSEIKVVVLDMMMPYLDASAAIRLLEEINPEVKIIAVSGLASNETITEINSACVKIFLSKPYTSTEVLNKLQMVIDYK
ncbi:PAS/PAC sensor hybrid histidine kinase [Crinalium epipsammum PCC 9333]|uniref:histidine kinase n=1 Tax=Crinalium epipsammum PCC 9333 TaxID=1173022 RepID=K9W441_9CYAN|nr:response regulator [Crinalium epipsammum]AFZ15118.1 PAS/PAC sensor hybrid histidine kinase [Crinalium epipsammum PCC 9333]